MHLPPSKGGPLFFVFKSLVCSMTIKYYCAIKNEKNGPYKIEKWDRDTFLTETRKWGELARVVDWKCFEKFGNLEFANDLLLSNLVVTISFKKKSPWFGAFVLFG